MGDQNTRLLRGRLAFTVTPVGHLTAPTKSVDPTGAQRLDIERCENMLTAGQLDVIVSKSSAAIHTTQVEDEGDTFLFWGAPRTILCLRGQDSYPSPKFPNDHFEVILDPGNTFYDLHLPGRKIPKVPVISGADSPGVLPDAATIFEGNRDTMFEDYKTFFNSPIHAL